MPTERFAETDPEEIEYSQHVVKLLERVNQVSTELNKHGDALPGSKLALDDARTPHYPVSSYGYAQLLAAVGCLESLGHMIIRENKRKDKKSIEIIAGPYGCYTLARNAMDCAAAALWLLEPASSTLRVKRRIMLEVDEIKNNAALRKSMGERTWEQWRIRNWARMQEVAAEAGITGWDPISTKKLLPKTTDMLIALERHHQNAVMPWLSAWQLSSGHAHGKLWTQLTSHQMDEIAGTRTETGATFRVSIRYAILAWVLLEAVQLIETAGARYLELLRPS